MISKKPGDITQLDERNVWIEYSEILQSKDLAIQYLLPGGRVLWIPKCEINGRMANKIRVSIWWAHRRGLA